LIVLKLGAFWLAFGSGTYFVNTVLIEMSAYEMNFIKAIHRLNQDKD
jgi:hypothetical protein